MKNKLSYLIGVACILSYTGIFTSCVNGVDDEYLEQKFTESSGTDEGEELPDLNGDYSTEGDYELVMTCNGELLEGKKVVMAVDEMNESATITFTATETDLESIIGLIPGGGLVGGLGLKYTGNSPVPGEKEITIANVPLYRNGTSYMFKGSLIQPTFTMDYDGKIENDQLAVNVKYELVNQKLAGTWNVDGPKAIGTSVDFTPLWCDWDSNVVVSLDKYIVPLDKYNFNQLFVVLTGALSGLIVNAIAGINMQVQPLICNMLHDVTAEPNGCMFATYSYSDNPKNPLWSSEMPHNILRYYYDKEQPDKKIYLEINSDFLVGIIKGLIAPATRADNPEATKQIARELFALLTPLLENGIPCDYILSEDEANLTINIDGVILRDILRKLMELANDELIKPELDNIINSSLGDFGPNISAMLSTMPNALKYHDYDKDTDTYSGECKYVKLGLKFVKK